MDFYCYLPVNGDKTYAQFDELCALLALGGYEFISDTNTIRMTDDCWRLNLHIHKVGKCPISITVLFSMKFGSDERKFIRIRTGFSDRDLIAFLKSIAIMNDGYYANNSKCFHRPALKKKVWDIAPGKAFLPYSFGELSRCVESLNNEFELKRNSIYVSDEELLDEYNRLKDKMPNKGLFPVTLCKETNYRIHVKDAANINSDFL